VPLDEPEPSVPADELDPVVAPAELELDELVPLVVGDSDALDPDVGAPELVPLDPPDPTSLGPPLLELDPFAGVPMDVEELAPLEPWSPVVGLPVASEELPHPAREPATPQKIAKAVRRCIALSRRSRCPAEGLTVHAGSVTSEFYVLDGASQD
jgi:hypothetical protein